MCEKQWIGHPCDTCGLPIRKDDPQEYSIYMMPVHREDYCIKYLLEELRKERTKKNGRVVEES